MEPLTAIVTAITTGAVLGLNDVAHDSIKDIYETLKNVIRSKYENAYPSLIVLEKKPESIAKQDAFHEDLLDTGAQHDIELLRISHILLQTAEKIISKKSEPIGIKLDKIKAANIILDEISVDGTASGVHINESTVTGDIKFSKVKINTALSLKKNA